MQSNKKCIFLSLCLLLECLQNFNHGYLTYFLESFVIKITCTLFRWACLVPFCSPFFRPEANWSKIPIQQSPTLSNLTCFNNLATLSNVVGWCWMLKGVEWNLIAIIFPAQHNPTLLLFSGVKTMLHWLGRHELQCWMHACAANIILHKYTTFNIIQQESQTCSTCWIQQDWTMLNQNV